FTKSVGRTGRLDESMLVLQTVGLTNIPGQIRNGPQGLRMLMKGKLPLPMVQQERVDNPKEVRRIYEAVASGEDR
ncbi:MAG: hypothetical protein ACRDG4_05310, partial [Chloroflexota bacterium]